MSTFEFDEASAGPKVDTASLPDPGLQQKAPAAAQPAAKPAAGGAPRGQIYTVMAREGINAAEVVNTAMKKKEVGKDPARRIEVIAPHGPSTSGGKKARQSITLVPISGQGGALMCGFLDVAQKSVEIRDYAQVADQFKKRFGARFDVTAEEYAALVKHLGGILETLGFKMSEEVVENAPGAAAQAKSDEDDEEYEDDDAGAGNSEFVLTGSERKKLAWLVGGAVLFVVLVIAALR